MKRLPALAHVIMRCPAADAEDIHRELRRKGAPLRANKRETFDSLKFALEGSGERPDGIGRPSAYALACRA
jgi:hypothetical protein